MENYASSLLRIQAEVKRMMCKNENEEKNCKGCAQKSVNKCWPSFEQLNVFVEG